LAVFDAIPSGVWIARTRLDLAEVALARTDRKSAVAHLGAAREHAVRAALMPTGCSRRSETLPGRAIPRKNGAVALARLTLVRCYDILAVWLVTVLDFSRCWP